jgi:hypothetical protein
VRSHVSLQAASDAGVLSVAWTPAAHDPAAAPVGAWMRDALHRPLNSPPTTDSDCSAVSPAPAGERR